MRAQGLCELQSGKYRCIFSVEILGEGVDVLNVNSLLLLRSTASPTVFVQQLGRGLRRASCKSHLTVIDLIGQRRREFRFEDCLRAIVDTKRGSVLDQVAADFPFLFGFKQAHLFSPLQRDDTECPGRRLHVWIELLNSNA